MEEGYIYILSNDSLNGGLKLEVQHLELKKG